MKEGSLCIKIVIVLLCLSVNSITPVCAETGSDEDTSIRLQSVRFDPVVSIPTEEPANLFIASYPTGIDSYIVQFDGPVIDEYTRQVSGLGVKFYGYVPSHAFIVRMDDATRQKVESLSFVRWVGLYQPAYRISPSVLEGMETDDKTIVNVLLFDVANDVVTSEIQGLDGDIITSSAHKVRVSIDSSKIPDIASIDGVVWIEKYTMPELCNNISAQIMNVDPIVWDTYGLNGTGQIVAIADTGLDTGVNDVTTHDDFKERISDMRSWPIQPGWAPFVENPGADDGASDADSGHGTHVSGSVLGNGTESNGDIKGIAYNASLFFQAIEQWVNMTPAMEAAGYPDGYYLAGIPDGLTDLFQQAYDGGARIHTNSWGSDVDGEYTSRANKTDMFMWNHKDMTILFSAGNAGNDSDRDGVVDYGSIGSPGTAKNVITVGASENLRPSGEGYDGNWNVDWGNDGIFEFPVNPIASDHVSDDSDGMAAFSSRGPCDDDRIKPEVVAPGTNILSTRSSVATGVGWGVCNQYYVYMGGTSMSTPLTAGTCALIRQYYMENISHTPNASLIKATLINGAFDMPGQYVPDETGPTPNNNSGWGRVDLANSIFPTPPKVLLFNDSEFSLSTGQNQSFYYKVANRTVPLNITMVWTDYPAIVPAGGIVNDLDLIVTSPCGDVYHGNDLIAPFNDTLDRTNNVEQVRISSPAIGVYNVTVNAYTVPNGPQDFSLAIIGAVEQVEALTEVEKAIEKGLCWLHATQNPDGSWGSDVGVTSLAALCFLNAGYDETAPDVRDAIGYIRSKVQVDGSIWSGSKTYHTSLATLALVATHNDSYDATIDNAAQWLKNSQWDEDCSWGSVNEDNWYYGGFGYGYHVRPDNSNTQFALMALDAVQSISKDDPLWDKAQVFLNRVQARDESNDQPWANGRTSGGFSYTGNGGTAGSGSINGYGSMTGAGIWGLMLSNAKKDDPRVEAALNWVNINYMWDGNPGMGSIGAGQYYYYLSMSKALTMIGDSIGGQDWYQDLSNNLTALQKPEGYWVNDRSNWAWEDNKDLVTSYAILSLQTRGDIPPEIQRLSWITFILNSSADLHVYDPLGRHVGKNYETGEVEIGIPNATYSEGSENITIHKLIPGNYRIVLIGTGTGEYTLNVTGGVGEDIVAEDSFTSTISEGEVHDADVNVAMITWLTIHIEEPDPIDAMVESATGTGNVSFVTDAGTIEDLAALSESDLPSENPGADFPHGLFSFNITGLSNGATVNVTINFPEDIPTTAEYWKYNTSSGEWYQIPIGSNDGDNIITIMLQDGGIGDNDGATNGIISDPGAPGVSSAPPPSATSSTATGAPKDAYRTNEDVYATGSGFAAGTNVDIYVVPDQDWNNGDPIPADVTGSVETVSVVDGDVGPVLIWHALLVAGVYDIVIDANRNGVYDAPADGLDSGSYGFVVIAGPVLVPTLAPIGIITLIGLLCVIGMIRIRRRFN